MAPPTPGMMVALFRRVSAWAVEPVGLVLTGWLLWVILLVLAPMGYDVQISFGTVLFVALCIAGFLFGVIIHYPAGRGAKPGEGVSASREVNAYNWTRLFRVVAVLAMTGVALRFIDLIVIKSYFSYGSATKFRLLYGEGIEEPGFVSIISAVLFPLAPALFLLLWLAPRPTRSSERLVGGFGMAAYVLYNVLRGGRLGLSLMLVALLLVRALARKRGLPGFRGAGQGGAAVLPAARRRGTRARQFTAIAVVAPVALYYSAQVLGTRAEAQGLTTTSALRYLELAHHVRLDGGVYSSVGPGPKGMATFTLVSFAYYETHGLYEFELLRQFRGSSQATLGSLEFAPLFRVLRAAHLVPGASPERGDLVPQEGVYTSFFGPLFVDFGWIGPGVCLLLGLTVARLRSRRSMGSTLQYALAGSVILHAPAVNLIETGGGFYVISSFMLISLVERVISRLPVRGVVRNGGALPIVAPGSVGS